MCYNLEYWDLIEVATRNQLKAVLDRWKLFSRYEIVVQKPNRLQEGRS